MPATHSKSITTTRTLILCALATSICNPARAQSTCGENPGPDLVVGNIDSISSYAVVNGTAAFALGTSAANFGTQSVQWQAGSNHHPIVVPHIYRYKIVDGAGRIEQIGLSWVHHHFTALADDVFCTCIPPGGGPILGVGCNDSDTSGRAGTQLTTIGGLGPRYDVNAHSGHFQFPYPFRNTNGAVPVTSITRRLQVAGDNLNASLNDGAQYFGEAQIISPDDAAARNQNNNCSHRRVNILPTGPNYVATLSGQPTARESPAIHAWQLLDPNVIETPIDTPELEAPPGSGNTTGRLILAARATHLTGPTWHYEYALFNMNSDRSVSGFSVPVPESAAVANIAFHDVDYHSGDGFNSTPENQINFDGADWPAQRTPTTVNWLMPAAEPLENSNALRWGTTYNFRFDADGPPARILGTINLFKPAPGLPDSISAITLAPVLPCLLGDLNHDGQVTPADIQPFIETLLEALPADPCPADLNQDGRASGPDIQLFAAALIQ